LLRRQRRRFCWYVSVFEDADIFVPFQMFELLLFESGDGVNYGGNVVLTTAFLFEVGRWVVRGTCEETRNGLACFLFKIFFLDEEIHSKPRELRDRRMIVKGGQHKKRRNQVHILQTDGETRSNGGTGDKLD